MSTNMCRWAPPFIFISLFLVLGSLRPQPAGAEQEKEKAEAEAPAVKDPEVEIAGRPDLYLRVDLDRQVVEIKVRGKVLATSPLKGFALLEYRPVWGGESLPPVALPAVWTAQEDASATIRRRVAPDALKPFSEDESAAAPPPAPAPEAPAVYRVRLSDGWELAIGQVLPAAGFWERFRGALADGWTRLRRRPLGERPPLLALALDPEDARRLHHIFRVGTAVLVS